MLTSNEQKEVLRMKRIVKTTGITLIALSCIFTLSLSGCSNKSQTDTADTSAGAADNPQLQALLRAEAAGLIDSGYSSKSNEADSGTATETHTDTDTSDNTVAKSEPEDNVNSTVSDNATPEAGTNTADPELSPSEPQVSNPASAEPDNSNSAHEVQTQPEELPPVEPEAQSAEPEPVAAEPTASPPEPEIPVSVPPAENKDVNSPEEDDSLTEEEALGSVTEPIDTNSYTVETTDTQLEISPPGSVEAHRFYVFAVKDNAGSEVGQIAVDRDTGEKFTYQGEGVIDTYDSFPLYDAKRESQTWEGNYKGPSSLWLTIHSVNEEGFEFAFSDGTSGHAVLSGDTAKSEDEELNFLLSEKIVTVAGKGLTGNYSPSDEEP